MIAGGFDSSDTYFLPSSAEVGLLSRSPDKCNDTCATIPTFSITNENLCELLPEGDYSVPFPCDWFPDESAMFCGMIAPGGRLHIFTYKDGNISIDIGLLGTATYSCKDIIDFFEFDYFNYESGVFSMKFNEGQPSLVYKLNCTFMVAILSDCHLSCTDLCSSTPDIYITGDEVCFIIPEDFYAIHCDLLPADFMDICVLCFPDGILYFEFMNGNFIVDLGALGVQTIPCQDIFGPIAFRYSNGRFTIENSETGEVAFSVPCADIIGSFVDCEVTTTAQSQVLQIFNSPIAISMDLFSSKRTYKLLILDLMSLLDKMFSFYAPSNSDYATAAMKAKISFPITLKDVFVPVTTSGLFPYESVEENLPTSTSTPVTSSIMDTPDAAA